MTQAYSNPERQDDPHALPDVEVFYFDGKRDLDMVNEDGTAAEPGYYYWFCFPGCMPDSGPIGPFATEQEAIDAAQEGE